MKCSMGVKVGFIMVNRDSRSWIMAPGRSALDTVKEVKQNWIHISSPSRILVDFHIEELLGG